MSGGARPRFGFLGTGWIGLARLKSLRASGVAEVSVVADPDPDARHEAALAAPEARVVESLEELLAHDLDAVVIATPSGLHAEQCLAAFRRGCAVFCQKPLARTAAETRAVVNGSRAANRQLAVDFCYRQTRALARVREIVRSGEIGTPFAVELTFHNAYGPDKRWAQDPALAGGGCLIDLGVHLIDAALWVFDFPSVDAVSCSLFRDGVELRGARDTVEDFAMGAFTLAGGPRVSFACSWRSSFGEPARIAARFFGTKGGVAFENVAGSFYDFQCETYRGPTRERLVEPPDEWGGRAIVAFAEAVRDGTGRGGGRELLAVAEVVDALYGRPGADQPLARTARLEAAGAP